MQDGLAGWHHPIHLGDDLATLLTTLRRDEPPVKDRSHLGRVVRLQRIGVVPEVDAVDALVVEPEADMVRVIDALTRPRIEWPSPGDERAGRASNRIEHGLPKALGPDVRRKRRAADRDVDPARRFVGRDGHW